MYCNKCGQFIEEGNNVCPNCGNRVNNNLNNFDDEIEYSNKGNSKLPMIFAACSLAAFILGIITKNTSFLSLIMMLASFILSEIGIKQSKKYNSKVGKIINSILGVVSILYFIMILVTIINAIVIRNTINDIWVD